MKKYIADFLSIFYPNLCVICGENLHAYEKQICIGCINEIPRTNYHLEHNNPIEKRFWGKVTIFRATSFYHFQKGSQFQKLLHELKYRGNKEVGEIMGKIAALDLLNSADFCSVDYIIPIPLHPKKLAKRGYNQSECIGKGLSTILEKPQRTDILIRTKATDTQTKKNVYERYVNTEGIFELSNKASVENMHILLVDDVLTTGSTIEAAIQAFKHVQNLKISIFTLAAA